MMNRNHLLRRMVALLLCTCMLLGNVSTAVSDNFIVQSNDVPISDAVEAASVAADNGSNAQEKVMLKNYAEYSFKLSADAGETQPLPEYVEDGQYMYFSMDFELLNNPESKISLLKEAYMAGEIDADTIFMCGINFLPFVENSNYPVSFDSPYNQAIDTNTGLTIFRWWVDEQLSEIHLRFTDEILSREGEISGAKIAFEGYLVTGGKNDNGELRFGVDGQTISLKAKQEYDLVKSVGTPYYSVDASSYLVDYTVTLQLDQAMKLSETDSALYAAALTLVDTVSNDSALSGTIIDVSVASAPEGETVTVTNSGNGKTNTMVIASPDDQILQKGTYTFVYKMKVNNDAALAKLAGYSEDQKTNTVELKENGQSLETPLTASAVITWEDVTDNQFKIEKDVFLNKAPDYNGIYIKDNDYCLDYRVVVYIREPVHTFTVADANWGSFDFREDEAITLEGIDDSEGYWDAPIQTAQLDQVRAAVTVTTENHPYGRDNKTTACKMITITAPEGEMLLPGAYHLRIPADVNDAVNATLNNTYSQYFENWAMLHRVDGNPTNVSDNYKSNIPLPFTTTKDGGYETNKDTGEFLTYEGKPVIRWDVWFGWDFYNKTTFEDTLTGMELLVNNDYPFEIHSFVNPKTLDETLVSLKTLEGTDSLDCLDFKADGSGFTVYAENLDSNSNDVLGKLYKIVYFTVPADDPSSTTGEYLTSGLKNKYTANHVPELGGGFGNGPHTGEVEPNIGAGARLYVSKKHVIELNDSLTKWKITCSNEQNKIPFANFTNLDIIDLVPRDQKPIGEVFVHYSDEHPITVEMLCDNNARIQLVEGTHYTIKKQMDGYAFGDDGKYGFAVDLNMETVAAAMAEKNAVYFKTIDVLCYLENEKHPSGQNYRIHNDGWLSYTNQGNDLEEGANAYYDRGFSTKTKGIIGYGDYYDPTAPRVYYVWENNSEGKPSYKGQQSFTGGYDDAPESGDGQKEILWRIFIGAREFGNDDNPITVTVTDTFSDNQMFPTYTGKDVKELFLIRAEDSMDYIIIPDNVVVNGNSFSLTFTVPGGGWASNNKDKSKDILIFYHTIIKPEAIKDALDAADSDADNVTLEYSNTVSAGWNGESYTFPTCTGSHAFSTTMLDKSADIITAVSEIEYSVLINENRIMLNNGNPLELTDELGQGKADYLYLDDSVRLVNLDTDAVLSAGSSVTENTYTITWETGDTKGFTISVPDGQRLKLTYHVRPQVEVGNEAPTLTNSATLVGKTASHEQDSFMVNAHYQQATYKPDEGQAAVIIRKKEGGNSVENWLAGAEFTAYPVLEDGTLGSVFKKVTTDDTGKATFDFDCDSEFGSYTVYCIKETKAPEGYQGSEQEWYFYFSSIHHEYANEEVERIVQLLREKQNTQQDKPITITQGFHQVVSYVTVENTAITSDLRIRKVNAAGADLEAATFVLQDAKGNRMPDPVAGVDQGVYYYTFSDLKNGTYTLTETMPPEGYQFSTPNSWTIVLDAGSEDETDSVSVVWPENATDAMKAYVVETTNAAVPTLTVLNDVAAPAELSIPVTKILDGTDTTTQVFTFTLEAETPGAPMPADPTVKTPADATYTQKATVSFGAIQYDHTHVGQTYQYKITETDSGSGFIGDESEYLVTVQVEWENGLIVPSIQSITLDEQSVEQVAFTNQFVPYTSISGTKTWVDYDNYDRLRPENLTITLLADGSPAEDADGNVMTKTISGEGNVWEYSFENLPKYDGNREIKYTVSEETVDGYVLSRGESEYDLINTHTPVTTITVNKTWSDNNNQDGKRAGVVAKVKLYKTVGETTSELYTETVGAADNWSKTWTELPVYEGGQQITYSVVETLENANSYTSDTTEAVVVANGGSKTITNSYTPEKTTITVNKTWSDNNNQDGKRAGVVAKVTLYKTVGETTSDVETVPVTADDNWSKIWTGLPVYEGGQQITYSVVETLENANSYTSDTTEAVVVANGGSKTITNSYTPEKTTITVNKTWSDNNNQDGKRADVVAKVTLYKTVGETTSKLYTETVGAADNWSKTWTELPVYEKGQKITYSVVETLENANGYTSDTTKAVVVANGGSKTITNSYTPEKTTITVNKTWSDNNNQDGKRAGVVAKVTLYKTVGETTSDVETVSVTADNNWSKIWTDLPVYEGGQQIIYSVVETLVTANGYTSDTTEAVVVANGGSKTITNSYTPEKTTITVNKTWSDNSNQDGKRADVVAKVTLYKTVGETTSKLYTETVGAADNWSKTWTELPVYENGQQITYSVVETLENANGYTSDTTEAVVVANGGSKTITNRYTPEKTTITVNKTWSDNNNQDGKRAGVVAKVTLYKTVGESTSELLYTETVGAADDWSKTWTELPVYEKGQKITYSVVETLENANGYTSDTTEAVVVANGGSKTIINSYTPEKTTITVNKTWSDSNNQDGKRAGVVAKVTLYKTVGESTSELLYTETVGAADNWIKTWTDLPVYENGQKITYSVVETLETANGYTSDTTEAVAVANGGSKTITNRYTPEKTTITVNKTWSDNNNQDGKRAGVVAKVTLYKTVGENTSDVETVSVTADNNWSKTWTDLPVYEGGQQITYSVVETLENANGYTSNTTEAVVVANGGSKTITNSYTPEKTTITVNKTWSDNNNQDGKRADVDAKVTLYKTVGETTSDVETVPVTADDNWSKTWENLPVYENGQQITYSVVETLETANGYTSDTTEAVVVANGDSKTITNSYAPEKTTITVNKTWSDNNNQDGKRADVVAKVTLYKTVGESTSELYTETVGVDDNWSKTWENLPVYENGQQITYSVVETLETANGYTSDTTEAVVVANGGSKTITNSYTPEVTEATILKIWDDADNQDGKRPVSLKVTLSNGTEVTLNEANSWTATVTDLPKYANGEEIVYQWTEGDMPEGYTLTSTVIEGTVTALTNSYTSEVTEVNGSKTWSDANNQDGIRPASITINLLADDVIIETVQVKANEDGEWKWSFTDLPKYRDQGTQIVYSITETLDEAAAAAYTAVVDGYNITNTHIPATVDVVGSKVWIDLNNAYHTRPESITIRLYADGTEIAAQEANANNNWSWSFMDLPKYAADMVGHEIVYTVSEDAVPGYVTTQNGYHFTNTVQVVAFQKLDEQTGKPLSGANFALYEGRLTTPAGTPVMTWTSASAPQLLTGLRTGQTYTIFETKTPFGYITMTPFVFTVQETDIPSDMRTFTANNRHSYRFRKLSTNNNELVYGAEMAIMQGDTVIATWFTSQENDGWHYVADKRFKAGVTYTLVELTAPNGYQLAAPVTFSIDKNDGFLIVNGKDTNDISVVMFDQPIPAATPAPEPTTTSFRVTKRWEDQENVLGLRPSSIVVNLYRKTSNDADYPDTPYLTVTINSNGTDEWNFTFSDLPRRDGNGRLYTYMVQEEPVEGYVSSYLNNGRTIVNSIPEEDLPPTPTPTLPYATPTPSPMPRVPAGVQFINGRWVYVDEYGVPLGGVPLTGDSTNFALWGSAIALPMLIAALAAVEIRRRKRKMATEGAEE